MKHFRLNVYWLALALLAVVFAPNAMAQTSSVELLGTVTAAQASHGLGFNLDGNNEWEWAAAAAAGAKFARIQCSWDVVEQQTAPPNNTAASTQYVNDPQCEAAFGYAAKYGISPIVVAGYGPPFHKILSVTVPTGAAVGATSFTVEYEDGVGGDTLANLAVPYDYFCPAPIPGSPSFSSVCASYISQAHSPEGVLVRAVSPIDSTHATITLTSALTVPLPASSSALYNISEILYASSVSERSTDPSNIAYGNYVNFLASEMAAHGIKGQVELWNEPPWTGDPWDNRCLLYDEDITSPCPSLAGSPLYRNAPNYGFVAELQKRTMPEGITLTWNGTASSGWGSILYPRMFQETGEYAAQPATVITEESFHPYGFEPEEMMWTTACLEKTAVATNHNTQNISNCYLPGEPPTSNYSWAVQADMMAKAVNPTFGIGHEITETGILPPTAGLEVPQARFIIRQFLGFQADGVTPINFFKLFDGSLSEPNFSFVQEAGNTSSYTAKPSYTAISGFMADIQPISGAPATPYPAETLPAVISYTGTFPLSTAHMVGARSGASANSDAFTVWQRTFVTCTNTGCNDWSTQASPAAAPITVSIPATMKVTQLVNLTTRDNVTYTTSGGNISFLVSDDPIEVLVDPTSSTATGGASKPTQLSLGTSNASSVFGQPVVLTTTVTPSTSGSNSSDGENVLFLSGSTQLGTGTLVGGIATLQTSALLAGSNTVVAKYAGDSHFGASTGFTPVVVAKADPGLAIPAIADQTWGAAPIAVQPTSNSPGQLALGVLSGPATIANGNSTGGTVVLHGIGTVVLGATQVPTANYNAASMATTSFVVNAAIPGLFFGAIAPQKFGNGSFPVGAKSVSHGAVTYSVVSGPATMSGSTVTMTGAGTVVLQANQQANGVYLADTATITFTVARATANLHFQSIGHQTFGAAPITVSATSVSDGAVTYTIVSGPATISGNVVTLTGAGNVVVGASQAQSTNYNAITGVTTTIVVNPATAAAAFQSFTPKSYGDAPFAVKVNSASPAPITYKVTKGPATVAGSVVTLNGAGTVGIEATQPAQGDYVAMTATMSFVVAKLNPELSMAAIPSKTWGAAAFAVTPSTNSPGQVALEVVSGPATISGGDSTGGTVILHGIGTVVLGATQVPTANYNAAPMVTTSFVVNAADPGLAFKPVPAQTYGNGSFPVAAKSASHGSVTYSVVSGPARVSGSTVTMTGAGTVVLQAVQEADGTYLADTATTTFVVAEPAS